MKIDIQLQKLGKNGYCSALTSPMPSRPARTLDLWVWCQQPMYQRTEFGTPSEQCMSKPRSEMQIWMFQVTISMYVWSDLDSQHFNLWSYWLLFIKALPLAMPSGIRPCHWMVRRDKVLSIEDCHCRCIVLYKRWNSCCQAHRLKVILVPTWNGCL